MKTITFKTFLLLLFFMPLLSMAQYQSPIDKVYQKYTGQDGFTFVNITQELFQMMMKLDVQGEGTEDVKEIQDAMGQLEGLKVIKFEDDENPDKAIAIYKEFSSLFPSGSYAELMTIQEKGNNIRFLTKQDAQGKIQELVMLAQEDGEVTALSLVGHIDMSTVSKLSNTMKIQGMENLKKMDKGDKDND